MVLGSLHGKCVSRSTVGAGVKVGQLTSPLGLRDPL